MILSFQKTAIESGNRFNKIYWLSHLLFELSTDLVQEQISPFIHSRLYKQNITLRHNGAETGFLNALAADSNITILGCILCKDIWVLKNTFCYKFVELFVNRLLLLNYITL